MNSTNPRKHHWKDVPPPDRYKINPLGEREIKSKMSWFWWNKYNEIKGNLSELTDYQRKRMGWRHIDFEHYANTGEYDWLIELLTEVWYSNKINQDDWGWKDNVILIDKPYNTTSSDDYIHAYLKIEDKRDAFRAPKQIQPGGRGTRWKNVPPPDDEIGVTIDGVEVVFCYDENSQGTYHDRYAYIPIGKETTEEDIINALPLPLCCIYCGRDF